MRHSLKGGLFWFLCILMTVALTTRGHGQSNPFISALEVSPNQRYTIMAMPREVQEERIEWSLEVLDNQTLTHQTGLVIQNQPTLVAIDNVGRRIAYIATYPTGGQWLTVYDTQERTSIFETLLPPTIVAGLSWNWSSSMLIYVVGRAAVIVDLVSSSTLTLPYEHLNGTISNQAFSPVGSLLAISTTASGVGKDPIVDEVELQIWNLDAPFGTDAEMRQPILRIIDVGGGGLAWNSNGTRLAISRSRGFRIYSMPEGTLVYDFDLLEMRAPAPGIMRFNYADNRLAVRIDDSIRIYDLVSNSHLTEYPIEVSPLTLAWRTNSSIIYSDYHGNFFENGRPVNLSQNSTPTPTATSTP